MGTLTYSGAIVIEVCWCGTRHGIPAELAEQARENGQRVYCPLGHIWVVRKTDAQVEREKRSAVEAQLARERSRLDQERAAREAAERQARSFKGVATKARRRAAAAMCPVPGCKRQLVQLQRHLEAKHPEWIAEHVEEPA